MILGEILAEESPVEADVVIPVPDSGVPSAVGFAQESDTLKYGNAGDANPFLDIRVRQAVAQAINVPAIPISTVAMAPPGSRPGIIALAASPTTVPNPIQVSARFA